MMADSCVDCNCDAQPESGDNQATSIVSEGRQEMGPGDETILCMPVHFGHRLPANL